jgi:hypothetical protein
MRIKNKPQARTFDTYVEAHKRAFAWAHKAVAYRHVGKFSQAKTAVQKVNHWLRRILALETQAARVTLKSNGVARGARSSTSGSF